MASISRTRQKLLENFDDEVRERLRLRNATSTEYRDRFEELLLRLTRHELGAQATDMRAAVWKLRSIASRQSKSQGWPPSNNGDIPHFHCHISSRGARLPPN